MKFINLKYFCLVASARPYFGMCQSPKQILSGTRGYLIDWKTSDIYFQNICFYLNKKVGFLDTHAMQSHRTLQSPGWLWICICHVNTLANILLKSAIIPVDLLIKILLVKRSITSQLYKRSQQDSYNFLG